MRRKHISDSTIRHRALQPKKVEPPDRQNKGQDS